jgi:hypothetical protein
MADDNVSVESIGIPLLSEIPISSATRIRGAYLPVHKGGRDEKGPAPTLHPGDEPMAGPNALVCATKITHSTPTDVAEQLLMDYPDRKTALSTHDFLTVILVLSLRLGDPSTTRLINGTVDVVFPEEVTIISHSSGDKGRLTRLTEYPGDHLTLSQGLVLHAPPGGGTKNPPGVSVSRFRIPVGNGESMGCTYNPKTGYSFEIPAGSLLEYQGMVKNPHDLFWEIYPPMPPMESTLTGTYMLALFSFILQTPRNYSPVITACFDCRVKGNLWGVIPLRGSTVF